MRILSDAAPLGESSGAVHLALGVFDGVHLGHQMVIRQTLEDAKTAQGSCVVVTFDRHPASVVDPANAPGMIQPLWRRLEAIAEIGVDAALVFPFDEDFSRQSAAAFVRRLQDGFGRIAEICVGAGFVFGHRRSGTVELLARMGEKDGFKVQGIPPLQIGGEAISSSRVRERIASGAMRFPGRDGPDPIVGGVKIARHIRVKHKVRAHPEVRDGAAAGAAAHLQPDLHRQSDLRLRSASTPPA
jgi:riboflavin kinase/FMN adenylyltransferase